MNGDKGYILRVDFEYPKNLHDLHNDLLFLPERMKIKKCDNLVCNLYYQNNYAVHIRALKQALNHRLTLKKWHRVTEFNQEAWLEPYIRLNTDKRKETSEDKNKYK